MRRWAAVAALVLAAGALPAAAQSVPQARAAFDRRRVLPGEVVNYTITLMGQDLPRARQVPAPDFADFEVLGGPMTSQSSEVRIVDGRISQRQIQTFSWTLLPRHEGSLGVGPLTLAIGSTRVQVARAPLDVVAPGPGAPPPEPPAAEQQQEDEDDPLAQIFGRTRSIGSRPWQQPQRRPGISVRTVVDDADAWLGQEIAVSDILSYDTQVTSVTPPPDEFAGFSKTRNEQMKIEGKPLRDPATGLVTGNEAVLNQWGLVPLTAGPKTIPAHTYTVGVLSSDPMGLMAREVQVPRSTTAVSIQVRPLPEGAPATFSGAVGSFQMEARLSATKLKAGDGASLVVQIKGAGSFQGVQAPRVEAPDGIKVFDPEVSSATRFGSDGHTEGTRTFTFPVLVGQAGRLEIPPISWAFFDPRTGRYVERRTDPLAIDAAPGVVQSIVEQPPQSSTFVVEDEAADIRHVRATLAPWEPDLGARSLPRWIWLAAAFGPAVNVLVLGALGLARIGTRDPVLRRAQGAARRASGRLDEAKVAAKAGRPVDAADLSARAVGGMVSDRLGLGSQLTPAEAGAAVAAAGDEALGRDVEAFLTECDFARFASGAEAPEPRALADAARALVGRLSDMRAARSARA